MRLPLARFVACLVFAHTSIACSSEDGASGGGFKEPAAAFDGICRGVLLTSQVALPSLPATGGGIGWGGSNNPVAPPGTSFLLATDNAVNKTIFRGYLYLGDGRAARMGGDFSDGLIKDTDFTTECDATKGGRDTLLVATTVFPNVDLSGDACPLPVGTDVLDVSVTRTGEGPITLSGARLTELCGLAKGYAGTLIEVALVSK